MFDYMTDSGTVLGLYKLSHH